MDQSAFRAILASSSTSAAKGKPPPPPPKAKFGAPPPKRSAATAVATAADASPKQPELKPRNQKDKSKYKKAAQEGDKSTGGGGGGYRDRAAERRTGGPNDFAQAEKLLEDFKARAEASEVDKDTLEQQMRYLGGDAEHSVLVKGLDMALLEREKAKVAGISDQTLEDMEDELDRQLLERKAKAATGKKRTRDDIIAELKARNTSGGGGVAVETAVGAEHDKQQSNSRFKPIGASSGWKKVAAATSETAEPEKKKRRKRKVVAVQHEADVAPSPAKDPTPPPAPAPARAEPAPQPLPLMKPTVDLEDDNFDIFGDAGDYKGLDTDSDSDSDSGLDETQKKEAVTANEHEEHKPEIKSEVSPVPNPHASTSKRKYFDDDDEEENEPDTTAPSQVTKLGAANASANADRLRRSGAGSRAAGADEPEDGEEEQQRPMRLQPLSKSAIPNVKDLLDMDREAEKEEKRKERKAHFQMKAADKKEAMLKKMTPEERAAHDHQVMMSYLDKKARRAKGETVDDEDNGDPPF